VDANTQALAQYEQKIEDSNISYEAMRLEIEPNLLEIKTLIDKAQTIIFNAGFDSSVCELVAEL